MNRHVTLHLVDPEGTLELARWTAIEFLSPTPPRKIFVYVNVLGRLDYSPEKIDVNREKGALLGTLTWRPVKKEVVVRGLLLSDIFDELVEAFSEVGMRAVLVKVKPVRSMPEPIPPPPSGLQPRYASLPVSYLIF